MLVLLAIISVSCSGATPTNPSTTSSGSSLPAVDTGGAGASNVPPRIGAFVVQGTRQNEPPNFADASEQVPVGVEVTDPESPISALKFNWSASAGTFSGSGRQVTWNAPASVPVPSTVTLNLEVVEPFTYQGRNVENKVAGSTTVSLHNSTKEVGDMARQFLLDFSDSSIKDLPTIMRNFEPTCPGTTDETYQVSINRRLFNILSSSIGESAVTLKFGGTCPFRNRAADACVQISAYWKSAFVSDNPESNNKIGDITEASGTDQLTAFYYRNQRRWRLCDSDFNGTHTLRKVPIGLVP